MLLNHMFIFYAAYFKMYVLCKTTEPKNDQDIQDLGTAIQDYCHLYRKYISPQVPPKVHYIEAHFIDFAKHYRTLWLYAEEGIESFHHWLTKFRDSMNHCSGVERKLRGLDEKIQSFQHPSAAKGFAELKGKGRQRAVHKRPNRKKITRHQKWDYGLKDQAKLKIC
jgi:hypothetical protein